MVGSTNKNKHTKYSYADYMQWTDDKRYEIIDGIVYDMNAPLRIHQEITFAMARKLADFFDDKPCKVYISPFDVRLPKKSKKDENIFNVVQPDISVICDEDKLDERGCIGAPDIAIEVISPSTASHDHIRKRNLYEKHKVKEYWLVDPINRIVIIYTLENNTYSTTETFGTKDILKSATFPDLEINLAEVFPVLPKVVCENPPPGYVPRED